MLKEIKYWCFILSATNELSSGILVSRFLVSFMVSVSDNFWHGCEAIWLSYDPFMPYRHMRDLASCGGCHNHGRQIYSEHSVGKFLPCISVHVVCVLFYTPNHDVLSTTCRLDIIIF